MLEWIGGFLFENGQLATTTSTVGARWVSGFLRDAQGRLVVVNV